MKEIEDAVQKLYVPRLQDPSGAAFDAELLHVTKGFRVLGLQGRFADASG